MGTSGEFKNTNGESKDVSDIKEVFKDTNIESNAKTIGNFKEASGLIKDISGETKD